MIRIDQCPICGSDQLVPFAASPASDQLHFAQVRCAGCGLLVAQPQASPGEMDAYYRNRYYQQRWSDADALWDENLSAHARYTLPVLERLTGRPLSGASVLEVGCGYGAMLATLAGRGNRVFGLELSHKAAAFAGRRGIPVTVARFPNVPFRPASFDFVIARHVIEHVPDPRAFVAALLAQASPGGLVVIETENAAIAQYAWDRLRAQVRGRIPPFRSSTDHTFVFGAAHLDRLLRDAGCGSVATGTFTEVPPHESPHWRAYKAVFRTVDRLCGGGEFLMAVGFKPPARR